MIGFIALADVLTMLSEDADECDGTTVQDTLDHKRQSPGYPQLLTEVRRDGITIPVLIRTFDGSPWLADGHHRAAAAIDAGLDTIPWTDVPLDVEPNPFNPYMRGTWGPYRPAG